MGVSSAASSQGGSPGLLFYLSRRRRIVAPRCWVPLWCCFSRLRVAGSATRCEAEARAAPPSPEVARVVDEVAAQFVAANGRGLEGHETPALKAAARAYKAKVSSLPMPWPYSDDKDDARARRVVVPNFVHWAWRNGEADWTLALSVAMAKVVQRPERLMIHTGPLEATQSSFMEPATQGGVEALRCLRACGVQEIRHDVDPAPGNRHPWSEVMRGGARKKLSKQTLAHISDVMRLYTIVQYGGIYLDRDAFLHLSVDAFRGYDAVLGLDPQTFEGDHDVNFGTFMASPNSTFFRLLWDACGGLEEYRNLSYLVTWGGWAHDSCRKSFALAIKRPDLAHVDERLYQFPFPGKSAAKGSTGKGANTPTLLLAKTRVSPVLHMSGFEWHSLRTSQLRARPSIFGTIVWPNVLAAATRAWGKQQHDAAINPDIAACLFWLHGKLQTRGYIPPDFAFNLSLPGL